MTAEVVRPVVPFDSAEAYRALGWTGTIPLPRAKKDPPPSGFTGAQGRYPKPADIAAWRANGYPTTDRQTARQLHHEAVNLGLRLPPAVVGLDVDQYDAKTGGDALAALEDKLGVLLPPTWISTSRCDGVSGIRVYRLPPGTTVDAGNQVDADIELIRHGHRYIVAAPSVHPEGGVYRWIRPDGTLAPPGEFPATGELPELPGAWVVHLTGRQDDGTTVEAHVVPGSRGHRRETTDHAQAFLDGLPAGDPCSYVAKLRAEGLASARRENGSAHDNVRDDVLAMLRAGETGHPGIPGALADVKSVFVDTIATRKNHRAAGAEFNELVLGGAKIVLGDPGERAGKGCDCPEVIEAWIAELEATAEVELAAKEAADTAALEERQASDFEAAVRSEADRMRVREEAARRVKTERAGAATAPEFVGLTEFLAVTDEPEQYRIDRLWPVGGRAVLAAQYKAGKSTLRDNLIRSLVDGEPFLGHFGVAPLEGTIAVIDDELDSRMLRRWLREQGMANTDQVHVLPLRGKVATFDLLDPQTRSGWAAQLLKRGVQVVILDCLRPVLDAFGLSEDKEAGRFLVAFDALLAEAGAREALVLHHMGHAGERSRGDTRLRDWPDVEWRLVREADDKGNSEAAARRFFTAYGRDVDVPEGLLTYDPHSRHLTYGGGNRKDTAADAVIPALLAYVAGSPGASGRVIEKYLTDAGHTRATVRLAMARVVEQGVVYVVEGGRNAQLHYLRDTP